MSVSADPAALTAALALAAVHLLARRMRFLDRVPRSSWLSAFGGISVAYVFAHLLPELAEGQAAIEGEALGEAPFVVFLENHVYLVALLGLALFYGVELHSRRSRNTAGDGATSRVAFWVSIASFGLYNLVVGYLLLRGELESPHALVLYTIALGVHFVVNDFGLREHHKTRYDRIGRWVIASAVLVGWALGTLAEVPDRAVALVVAFIGGGVILNVLKEELPSDRQARFVPFLAGAVAYAVVLQLI